MNAIHSTRILVMLLVIFLTLSPSINAVLVPKYFLGEFSDLQRKLNKGKINKKTILAAINTFKDSFQKSNRFYFEVSGTKEQLVWQEAPDCPCCLSKRMAYVEERNVNPEFLILLNKKIIGYAYCEITKKKLYTKEHLVGDKITEYATKPELIFLPLAPASAGSAN